MNHANSATTPQEPTHDEIALCAFLLWEKEGRQPGRETTYWLQAEAQVKLTRQQQTQLDAAKAARTWPPQTAPAPKLATARAVTPAVAVAPVAAKPAARKVVPAAPARKALARA